MKAKNETKYYLLTYNRYFQMIPKYHINNKLSYKIFTIIDHYKCTEFRRFFPIIFTQNIRKLFPRLSHSLKVAKATKSSTKFAIPPSIKFFLPLAELN